MQLMPCPRLDGAYGVSIAPHLDSSIERYMIGEVAGVEITLEGSNRDDQFC